VPALPPVPPLDRQPLDYSDLAHWMTQMDQTIRQARRTLGDLAQGRHPAQAIPADPNGSAPAEDPVSSART
jgi:hypothetical protein